HVPLLRSGLDPDRRARLERQAIRAVGRPIAACLAHSGSSTRPFTQEAARQGGIMLLLTAQRLFSGQTTGVIGDQVLEIDDDGLIVDLRDRRTVPAGADLVDLGDVTLLPGLIDVHQHLAFDASADPVAQLDADADAALLLRRGLAGERAVGVGIPALRVLGDRRFPSVRLRDWFEAGDEVGPRIGPSGPPITTVNG